MYSKKNYPLHHVYTARLCKESLAHYSSLRQDPFFSKIEPYLPLLKCLNKQRKWQLWLLNTANISSDFVESIGLAANKIILLPHILRDQHDAIVEQALLNGNFSYILSSYPFSTQYLEINRPHKTLLFQLGSSEIKFENKYKLFKH